MVATKMKANVERRLRSTATRDVRANAKIKEIRIELSKQNAANEKSKSNMRQITGIWNALQFFSKA